MSEFWAIGLMTGTALDGFVDVALLKTDGENVLEFGPFALMGYSGSEREILSEAVNSALEWQFNGAPPAIFANAKATITNIYAKAINDFIAQNQLDKSKIDYIGAHGLTVLHHPPNTHPIGRTLQLLDGQKLANLVGIPTVYDFRSNDIANGGQGAPLAPIYHAALLRHANIGAPAAILNLGGVANITYWNNENEIAAFDCGPANGPINEWVELNGAGFYDKDGQFAARGEADRELLTKIMSNAWFDAQFPKSLDRYDFGAKLVGGMSLEDGCATLSALVGMAIDKGLGLFEKRVNKVVVAGGGRKNPILMRDIAKYANVELIDSDEIGLRGDAVEAECFAFLAVRQSLGKPISFPKTTGVKVPMGGGRLSQPNKHIKEI